MKAYRLLPFFIMFTVGCTPTQTFNVIVSGDTDHFTYEKEAEKSTLANPYKIKLNANKGYEIYEDEEIIQITNKHFPSPILRTGMWQYNKTDSTLTLFGSMINCDTDVKVYPVLKDSTLTVTLKGDNYKSKSFSATVNLEHPNIDMKIEPNVGYVTSSEITVEPKDEVKYTYSKNDDDTYQLKIDNSSFIQDIAITIGEAVLKP